jgi:hypothetical protein
VRPSGPAHHPAPGFFDKEQSFMRRLAGFLTALAFAASLATGAAVAKPHDNDHMMGGMMGQKHHCAKGQHWVHGYKNKNGKWVKGYCR